MKKIYALLIVLTLTIAAGAQTLNVTSGSTTYSFPAAGLTESSPVTFTGGGNVMSVSGTDFSISNLTGVTVDNTSAPDDNTVNIVYNGSEASVRAAGNVAPYVSATVNGAHVTIAQSNTAAVDGKEITYVLTGSATDGSFTLGGSYKCTISLAGVTLTNPSGAAVNITNSKRIQLSAKNGTENTLADGASGSQKACIYSKGQLQLQGKGTLNVIANAKHAIKSASYVTIKNLVLNITSAVSDGISCEEYLQMESGTVTISGIGDDGIQCDLGGTTSTGETTDHEDEDSGNIYIEGGTLSITPTADAAKGLKADGDVKVSGGTITISQTGNLIAETDDISYPTCIKAGGDVAITGGSINIDNKATGGKGISADGNITIDESKATVVIDIKANGAGGTVENVSSGSTSSSYKVYVAASNSGGYGGGPGGGSSSAWGTIYLYKSDGTLVQKLTNSVTKTSGNSTYTFYYYDFGAADADTYYFMGDNYTSRNTTYTIRSATFTGPTSGTDVYYQISNSYSTSGTTRTYTISNVTSTYGGTSDSSEDSGTSFNAAGLKADGNVTISGGTITIANSGEMSKSIKSKATTTISGGTVTLTPSGGMKIINNDASYSIGVKTIDFVQTGGTLSITASGTAGRGISATNITTDGGTLIINNSGAGYTGSNDAYTGKGLKATTSIKLNAGTITIRMTGNGGKGIKSGGSYTQGTSDGNGPVLTVSTTGSSQSSGGSSSGGWGGPGGMGGSSGSDAKAIKVMGAVVIYGGTTEVTTATDGAEGLESKTSITIEGGQHYFKCYDDCINSSGKIYFNGGVTVCYSNGNDAVDSNAGTTGAITIGNGVVFAYTTKGSPEEGLDCDNNSYIQITGTGIAISAGGSQGGGGGWGGSSSGNTISNAKQGYAFVTSTVSYTSGRYYTLADASGNNLVTYSFEAGCSSSLSLFTATGMVKGSSYNIKYSTSAPTNATTAWHGLYIGSSATGTTSVTSFTAQ